MLDAALRAGVERTAARGRQRRRRPRPSARADGAPYCAAGVPADTAQALEMDDQQSPATALGSLLLLGKATVWPYLGRVAALRETQHSSDARFARDCGRPFRSAQRARASSVASARDRSPRTLALLCREASNSAGLRETRWLSSSSAGGGCDDDGGSFCAHGRIRGRSGLLGERFEWGVGVAERGGLDWLA
jgi:hypothetical protein